MALLKRDRAAIALGPHFAGLFQIVMGAWLEYMTDYTLAQRQKHSSTSRATILHDLMVWHASRFVRDVEGADIQDLRGLKVLLLPFGDAMIVIRFKKLDDELMSRNQQTQQVADFRAQKRLEQLDFLGPTHNLELGYVLDAFGQDIRQISIVCPNGPDAFWDIELRADETVTKIVDIFERQPIAEDVNIVRPKKTPEEETGSESPADDKDK